MKKSVQQWEEAADEKMPWNTVLSLRGRSKDPFGRSLLGRFNSFVEGVSFVEACPVIKMLCGQRQYGPTFKKVEEINKKKTLILKKLKVTVGIPSQKKDARPANQPLACTRATLSTR